MPGGTIRSITLRILGDKAGAQAALNSVNAQADKMAATPRTLHIRADTPMAQLTALGDLLNKLRASAASIDIAANDKASIARLAAINQSIVGLQRSYDTLNRYSKSINTLALAKLETGARQTDLQFNALTASVEKFNTALSDAEQTAADAQKSHGGLGLGLAGVGLPLFGATFTALGAVHIAIDVVIESLVALISAAAAAGVAIYAMAPAAQDIYNHLKAVDTVNSALGTSIPPLVNRFQALQQAMAPTVVELYGGGINLLNHSFGAMGQTVHQVGTLFQDWVAKLDIWASSQRTFGTLLHNGVGFLQQFGQAIGNLLISIDNLLKDEPGIAHIFFNMVVGITSAIRWFTSLPKFIVAGTLALHAFYLWGGVVTSMLGRLAGATGLTKLATSMGALDTTTQRFLGVSRIGWLGITALAAAIGYAAYESGKATPEIGTFINTINSEVANLTASQALMGLAIAIGQVEAKMRSLRPSTISLNWSGNSPTGNLLGNLQDLGARAKATFSDLSATIRDSFGFLSGTNGIGAVFGDVGHFFSSIFSPAQANANLMKQSIAGLNGEIDNLLGNSKNLYTELGSLMDGTHQWSTTTGEGTGKLKMLGTTLHESRVGALSFQDALSLMDLAGVKANDSLGVMRVKINNLITGYKNMSVSGGLLSSAVNAVTFSTELQSSQVATLTGAYSTFLGVVQGGEQGLVAFAQGLNTQATSARAAHASYNGLNAASLTLRGNFNSNVTAAGSLYNALVTQAAAAGLGTKGTNMLTRAGKDMVGSMLAGAKSSKANTDQLFALAQIAGYKGVDSFKALSRWVGNTHGDLQNLDKITTIFATDSSNLYTDVKNLANAINQNLNTAMAQGIFLASGGTKGFKNFADSVLHTHGNIKDMLPSARTLYQELLDNTNNASAAKKEFYAFALMLHLSKQKTDDLWASLQRLGGEHPHPSVVMTGTGSWHISGGSGAPIVATQQGAPGKRSGGLGGMARGGMISGGVPNEDSVLFLGKPGEAVVPTHLVPAVAPLLKAHGVPGFASGGIIPSYSGNVPGMGPWAQADFNASVQVMAKQMVAQMSAAMKQAMAQALQSAAVPGFGIAASGPLQQYAKQLLAAYGWASQWPQFNAVVMAESGWNVHATNPSSGAYGIPQALPPGKMASAGADWLTNGFTQLRWMMSYIKSRWGSPAGAWANESSQHWYGTGFHGFFNSPTVIGVGDRPERVDITPASLLPSIPSSSYQSSGGTSGGDVYNITVSGDTNPDAAALRIIQLIRRHKKLHGNQMTGIG